MSEWVDEVNEADGIGERPVPAEGPSQVSLHSLDIACRFGGGGGGGVRYQRWAPLRSACTAWTRRSYSRF